MKEPNKRKPAVAGKAAPKKAGDTKVIRLDDLVAPRNIRGGGKTFFGGKQES